jgi:hypothetical protein
VTGVVIKMGGVKLKKLAVVLLLLSATVVAKDHYTITITVLSTKNITSEYENGSSRNGGGAFQIGSIGSGTSSGRSSYGHAVSRHVLAVGSDGNSYDLSPQDARDFLIPGNYPAYFSSRGMVVGGPQVCSSPFHDEAPCSKNDPSKHHNMKFAIVEVESKEATR